MLRLTGVPCIVLGVMLSAPTPGSAQINARALTLAGVNDCLTEAIATNTIDDDGTIVIFSCNAATARTLYNFLGKRIRAEVVQDRNGTFENRSFGHSACYHRIEDQGGNPADEFRCDLIMAIGDALAE